jgi:alginate O-acetyltransferase complex protein AlgI
LLFNSAKFILLFLPVTFAVYFFCNHKRWVFGGKLWLAVASLAFYASWDTRYLPLLLLSIGANYLAGKQLSLNASEKAASVDHLSKRNWLLATAIVLNVGVLSYYKYANFFVDNVNFLFGTTKVFATLVLPLGISFFTFTQIAYLVDCAKGKVTEYSFINYVLFVTFFPHLIAGPILHHREMMSQFESRWTWAIRYKHILQGLFVFSLGLFKKVVLADTFAAWANAGFDSGHALDFVSAWTTSLSYTFQLYFDFSGYCDMAIGAALLFNIWLPINFNSPYKALDIQDFWRRWHMTLSRFLRDYLYIPLGGNRVGPLRIYFNLMATFVLGGLWHGASWMFVIWGGLHGVALVVHRLWSGVGMQLPRWLAWLVTFLFINATWVFFRAKTWGDAIRVFKGMIDIESIQNASLANIATFKLAWAGPLADSALRAMPVGVAANAVALILIAVSFVICTQPNSIELMKGVQANSKRMCFGWALLCVALYATFLSSNTVFLYFNF